MCGLPAPGPLQNANSPVTTGTTPRRPGTLRAAGPPGGRPSFGPQLPGPGLEPMSNGRRGAASRSPGLGCRPPPSSGCSAHAPEAAEPGPLAVEKSEHGVRVTEKPPLPPKG